MDNLHREVYTPLDSVINSAFAICLEWLCFLKLFIVDLCIIIVELFLEYHFTVTLWIFYCASATVPHCYCAKRLPMVSCLHSCLEFTFRVCKMGSWKIYEVTSVLDLMTLMLLVFYVDKWVWTYVLLIYGDINSKCFKILST